MEQYGLGGLVTSIQPSVVLGTKQLLPLRDVSSVHLLTVHDMLPMDRPQDFGLLKRHLLPPAYRRSIAQADVLACVSHASRDRLLTHIPDAADRAVVVANAMTSALGTTPATPLADLTRQSFALVVGDRSRRKNVGFIVDLWPEVVARHPDARLVLVGPPGWGHNEELPALTRLFDRGSVVEAGFVTDSELRWAYENAVATLCPSRLEGFGLPVVEALSLGCPVILSTDPAQVEASAGLGTAVDLADRERWIDTIVDHFGQHRRPPVRPPGRSWAEVAEELVAASTNRIRSAAAQ
jgi:glycosyltransferase involved in cell wall biosynthesis